MASAITFSPRRAAPIWLALRPNLQLLINSYARELGILKEKDSNFTGADTRNGMTAVIAVKHPDPIFEGQTKTKLASADATKAVFTL